MITSFHWGQENVDDIFSLNNECCRFPNGRQTGSCSKADVKKNTLKPLQLYIINPADKIWSNFLIMRLRKIWQKFFLTIHKKTKRQPGRYFLRLSLWRCVQNIELCPISENFRQTTNQQETITPNQYLNMSKPFFSFKFLLVDLFSSQRIAYHVLKERLWINFPIGPFLKIYVCFRNRFM